MTRLGLWLAVCCLTSCSTAGMPEYENYQHHLKHLAIDTLHLRRPSGEPGVDRLYPDEKGYRSEVPPGPNFDCAEGDGWLLSIATPALYQCLSGSVRLGIARYRLDRNLQPELVLVDPEEAPACVRELLPRIPVPREIVFQSDEEGSELSCYNARLDLDEGKVFGVVNPLKRTYLQLDFPLRPLPEDPLQFRRVLLTWALLPFLTPEEPREFVAKVVPRALCQVCFGKQRLLDARDLPVYWPGDSGARNIRDYMDPPRKPTGK